MTPANATVPSEHIVRFVPASTVGAGSMVITTSSVAGRQGPAGSLVVSVSVTVPAAMSPGPGVYTALSRLALLNVPSPSKVDHVALVALPPIVPASVAVVPAHIDNGAPASTVGAGLMVITTSSLTASHTPAGSSVVSVSVTVPAAMYPGPGVERGVSGEGVREGASQRLVAHVPEVPL